jgi:hypothetical protein
MAIRRRSGSVAMSVLLLSVVGCGMQARDQAADDGVVDTEVEFVQLEASPSRPPEVSLNGERIPLVSMYWVVEGDLLSEVPDDSFSALDLQRVRSPDEGLAAFELTSAVAPTLAYVAFYADLDPHGIPTRGQGLTQCGRADGECLIEVGEESTVVSARVPAGSVVATLVVQYGLSDEYLAAHPDVPPEFSNQASWSVLLE